jgi:hypothetical protein
MDNSQPDVQRWRSQIRIVKMRTLQEQNLLPLLMAIFRPMR